MARPQDYRGLADEIAAKIGGALDTRAKVVAERTFDRDAAAVAIAAGMLAGSQGAHNHFYPEALAWHAYRVADALAERSKKEPGQDPPESERVFP